MKKQLIKAVSFIAASRTALAHTHPALGPTLRLMTPFVQRSRSTCLQVKRCRITGWASVMLELGRSVLLLHRPCVLNLCLNKVAVFVRELSRRTGASCSWAMRAQGRGVSIPSPLPLRYAALPAQLPQQHPSPAPITLCSLLTAGQRCVCAGQQPTSQTLAKRELFRTTNAITSALCSGQNHAPCNSFTHGSSCNRDGISSEWPGRQGRGHCSNPATRRHSLAPPTNQSTAWQTSFAREKGWEKIAQATTQQVQPQLLEMPFPQLNHTVHKRMHWIPSSTHGPPFSQHSPPTASFTATQIFSATKILLRSPPL